MKFKLTPRQCAHIINESYGSLLTEQEDAVDRNKIDMLKTFGGIHMDDTASVDIIKNNIRNKLNFKGNKVKGFNFKTYFESVLGLNDDSNNVSREQFMKYGPLVFRMTEYIDRFVGTTSGRGFAFEGFLAGLFGGQVTNKKGKELSLTDIIINGQNYSVKILRDNKDRFDLGSLKRTLMNYGGKNYNNKLSPVENFFNMFKEKGEQKKFLYDYYRELNYFLFARINESLDTQISIDFFVMTSLEVITKIIDSDWTSADRKKGSGFAIKEKDLDYEQLIFPRLEYIQDKIHDELLGYKYRDNHHFSDIHKKIIEPIKDDGLRYKISRYLRPEVLDYFDKNAKEIGQNLLNYTPINER